MKTFFTKVDTRSREKMTAFLRGHERYSTMNSWNNATGYANCIKVSRLNLPADVRNVMYVMLDFFDMSYLLDSYGSDNDYSLQAGVNGRSGGYIVMYKGGIKKSEHKSVCGMCGQRNFTTVEESGTKCGKCGATARHNADFKEIYTQPGQGIDHGETFEPEEWTMDDLRRRVKEVQDFDRLCDMVVEDFVGFCRTHQIEDREVVSTKTVKVAVEK